MRNNTAVNKRYRLRKARGIPGTMPIHLVQARIRELNDINVTNQMIAYAADVTVQCIDTIMRRSSSYARIDTAAKIWTVTHHPHPRQKLVLAIGARRRIRALNAIGWPTTELAARIGINSNYVLNDSIAREHITLERWTAIRDLYEELSGTPGGSATTISAARRYRYAPPLAWEGRDINDPLAQPDWKSFGIRKADRPVCRKGHEYTPANTHWRTDRSGKRTRICRACDRSRSVQKQRDAA